MILPRNQEAVGLTAGSVRDRHQPWWSNYWSRAMYYGWCALDVLRSAMCPYPRMPWQPRNLNHRLADCYCLMVYQCWCRKDHQHRCKAYNHKGDTYLVSYHANCYNISL